MHLSPNDEGFWGRVPADYLKPLVISSEKGGVPLSIFAMGDPHDPETPAFAVFRMGPGSVLPRHSHDCERFEVIIQGSMDAVGPGEGDRHLETGDVMLAGRNEMYGPHVAGPEGFTVVEYFSRLGGLYEITLDTKRGPWKRNILEEDTARMNRAAEG
ncbi:MAG: hypothetical protein ACKVWR_10720 [Acidimicrobiales bacterium]